MASPVYKFSYFDTTGMGEPIRYLFAYAGIPYEDNRVSKEQFVTLKKELPFGKLPILEIDGKVVTQSVAIARYIARKAGLTGKTDLDALLADEIVDVLQDLRQDYFPLFLAQTDAERFAIFTKISTETNPLVLGRLEKTVQENGGYFVNGQLTLADIYFACLSELLIEKVKKPLLDAYPNLKALREKVETIPSIAAWREKRPALTE